MAQDWLYRSEEIIGSGTDLVSAILKGRKYSKSDQELFEHPSYDRIASFASLPNIASAVKRISTAIKNSEHIAIYGDYDIDGLCATALMHDALSRCGANVTAYIPDRFSEGYGLNSEALQGLHERGVQLVVTVDCGISSAKEVAEASKLCLDIIVTDHHTIPEHVPDKAIALINPKLSGSNYSNKDLAGVGVAFQLVRALQQEFLGVFPDGQEKWLLDYVALGTICDVVPLRGENWLLARYGLAVLRKSRRAGIQALMKVSGVDQTQVTEYDIGFRLGPRLNAAGRVEHANLALELLTTIDRRRAAELAAQLQQLNYERQTQTKKVYQEAKERAAEQNRPTIVLASADWSHGVVGIVASKLAEKFQRPTILLGADDTLLKGSGRSYGDINLINAITQASEKLVRFGGHHFAAGLSIEPQHLGAFHDLLDRAVEAQPHAAVPRYVDVTLGNTNYSTDLLDELSRLAPFGSEHEAPRFYATFHVSDIGTVGADKSHVQLRLRSGTSQLSAIAFSQAESLKDVARGDEISAVFTLEPNIWNGVRNLQCNIIDAWREGVV